MKKMTLTSIAVLALLLTACGSSTAAGSYEKAAAQEYSDYGSDFSAGYAADAEAYDYDTYADTDYAEADYAEEALDDTSSVSSGKEITEDEIEDHGSKIIRNASLDLEVDSLDQFATNLKKTVYDYDGYIESMDINAYDSEYSESRYGYFTARIPAERLDDFLNIVTDEGIVTAKTESAEDVTLQYVDIEARIKTYEAERDSLMQLLDTATNLKDILTLRDKIAEVNYELDSLNSQIKSMSNRVSYSTVSISAQETRTLAGGGGEKTFWSKIGDDFMYEMEDGLEMAINFLIFIITRLPIILLLALVVFIIVKIIQAIIRSSQKNQAKRMQKQMMQNPAGGRYPQGSPMMPPAPPAPAPAPAPATSDSKDDEKPSGSTHYTSNDPVSAPKDEEETKKDDPGKDEGAKD